MTDPAAPTPPVTALRPAFPGVHAHVGMVTCDIDGAIALVQEQLGVEFPPPIDFATALAAAGGPVIVDGRGNPVPGASRVVTSIGGPFRVEILEGLPGSVWYCDHVVRLHHLAYWVDDVTGTAEVLLADGWNLEVTIRAPDARPSGFAYLTRADAARIELTRARG